MDQEDHTALKTESLDRVPGKLINDDSDLSPTQLYRPRRSNSFTDQIARSSTWSIDWLRLWSEPYTALKSKKIKQLYGENLLHFVERVVSDCQSQDLLIHPSNTATNK